MKQLLITIVFLLLLVWVFYDIKSSIKTGEARLPQGPPFIKKEHPRLFKFAIMIKILAICCGLFGFIFYLNKAWL